MDDEDVDDCSNRDGFLRKDDDDHVMTTTGVFLCQVLSLSLSTTDTHTVGG